MVNMVTVDPGAGDEILMPLEQAIERYHLNAGDVDKLHKGKMIAKHTCTTLVMGETEQ
jgi:hypothetical protein